MSQKRVVISAKGAAPPIRAFVAALRLMKKNGK